MSELNDRFIELLDLLNDATPNVDVIQQASNTLLEAAEEAPTEETTAIVKSLGPAIGDTHPLVGSILAVYAGALVEFGAEVGETGPVIVDLLAEQISGAVDYIETSNEKDMEPEETQTMQALAGDYGEAVMRWQAFNNYGRAALTMMQNSSETRAAARANPDLVASLEVLRDYNSIAVWLFRLVGVLDDAELVVLHPEQRVGFRVKISGIADNFQLQVLLADAIIGDPANGWMEGEKFPAEVVAAMRDQRPEDDLTGSRTFNMLAYTGLQPDKTAASTMDDAEHWIFSEDPPVAIPQFDGVRVVLIGELPYESATFNAERAFGMLPGSVEVVEKLDKTQVEAWLDKIIADSDHTA